MVDAGITPLAAAPRKPLGEFIKPTAYQSASFLVSPCPLYSGPVSDSTQGTLRFSTNRTAKPWSHHFSLRLPPAHILPRLNPTRPFSGVRTPGPTLPGEEGPLQQMLSKKGGKRARASRSIKPDTPPFPHHILLPRTTSYPSESPSVPDLRLQITDSYLNLLSE